MLPADRVLLERLGARLRKLREAAKLTQDAVGERAGFGGKYIGEIEKGIRDVPLSTLRAVAESGLGVQLDSLFTNLVSRRSSRAMYPRDVEITASMITALPLKFRRPILALVKVTSDQLDGLRGAGLADHADQPGARAAERRGPKWQPGRRQAAKPKRSKSL